MSPPLSVHLPAALDSLSAILPVRLPIRWKVRSGAWYNTWVAVYG